MTLPAAFSMQDVNVELGRAAGFAWNMSSDVSARQLANVNLTPGSAWQLSSLAGKSCFALAMVVGQVDNQYGYADASSGGPVFGSLNPKLVFGQSVAAIYGDGGMIITINGSLAKDFWRVLELKDNVNGSAYLTVYSEQAAFYQVSGGRTNWGAFPAANPNFASRIGQTVYNLFMK